MIAEERQQVIFGDESQFHNQARQRSVLLLLEFKDPLTLLCGDDPALDQPLLQAEVVFHFLLIPPFDCFYDSKFQRAGETVVNVKMQFIKERLASFEGQMTALEGRLTGEIKTLQSEIKMSKSPNSSGVG